MTNAEWLAVERPGDLARIIHDSDESCECCSYRGKCECETLDCESGVLEWLLAERD